MEREYLDKLEKIEIQSEYWVIFARYCPIVFFLICGITYWLNIVDIKIMILIGTLVFVVTSIFWWVWTLYNIRFLVKSLTRATTKIIEVKNEVKSIHKDLKNLNDDSLPL